MRVLYVEDSPVDADLLQRALRRDAPAIELHIADSLASAKRLISEGGFDLLLSDLKLPDGSGLDLLADIRSQELALPVIMVTGQGNLAAASAALKGGAHDYIVKHDGYLKRLPELLLNVLADPGVQRPRGRPLRVLCAEPAQDDADLTCRHVARFAPHISLDIVTSADEALARFVYDTDGECAYQVVLLDYALPDLNGLDVARRLRREHGLQLPIVLTTREASEQMAALVLHLGIDEFLIKSDHYLYALPGALESAYRQRRLQTEHATLQALNDHYTTLLAASPTLTYTLDASGLDRPPTWVSENIERMLGYSVAEAMMPNWWWAHLFDDDRERVTAREADVLATGRLEIEYRFWHKDGRLLWICDRQRLIRDKADKPAEIVGTWDDITKEMSSRLEREEHDQWQRQMNAALADTRDGIIITDLKPSIVSVNQAWMDITGYSRDEVIGKNPSILSSGRQTKAQYAEMWRTLIETGHWKGEFWNRRKNGDIYPQLLSVRTVQGASGEPTHYVGVTTDLSGLRQSEEERNQLIHYDSLTNLPNRLMTLSRLRHAIDQADRQGCGIGVICFDLDHFKRINDSLGHIAGDQLLVEIAQRLKTTLRKQDTLARLGGDEFLIILEQLDTPDAAARVARKVLNLTRAPILLNDDNEVFSGCSGGISIYPDDGTTAETLIQHADTALNQAKKQGRDQYCFYTRALGETVRNRLKLETLLRVALGNGELSLHYQPQVDMRSGQINGVEALMRWHNPALGDVSPAQFIPVAEQSDLILTLGAWALKEACRQNKQWQDEGLPPLCMAVNVSVRQFGHASLIHWVKTALEDSGLEANYLEIELTESALVDDAERVIETSRQLHALGVRLSLDDFGTGYSSLAYLSRLPFDKIKIDQSFVRDITSNPINAAIAETTIALAESLRMTVLAEGVETESQLNFLRLRRCVSMQGYLFSRPLTADAFAKLQREGRRLTVADLAEEQPRTLLLLDDEPYILRALQRLVRTDGYRVLATSDPSEAFDLLARNQVQVIVSDQRMPQMSGIEFLSRVKELYPETIRIVLSGYSEVESITQAVNRGAIYKFFMKPWDDALLRAELLDAFRVAEKTRAR